MIDDHYKHECSECGTTGVIPVSWEGKRIECPECGHTDVATGPDMFTTGGGSS